MAEAAAAVGLVASIASLIDLSAKVISRIRDLTSKSSDVPETFRALSTRLPLLTATLHHIQSQAEAGYLPEVVSKALSAVVDLTSEQISTVQISLSKILPSDGASKVERALKALKILAKEDRIQQASEKIYRNNDALVLYQTTRHVEACDRILETLSKPTQESKPRPCSTVPFRRLLEWHWKSQLAIEYSYQVRNRSPEIWVFWVHASSKARIEEGYRRIAGVTRLPGWDDPKVNILQLVRAWLRDESNGRWMMIVDNADDSNVSSNLAGEILPESSNGSVLVTARSREAAFELVGNDEADESTSTGRGKYEEAEPMNRRALDGRDKVLGKEHPDTLASVSSLASVLRNQGKYEEAEPMNRRALDGRDKVLGKEHPNTLTSVSNLASVLQRIRASTKKRSR
ncbi:MAG: hypothetical protein Q9194_006182 [Teloschistes cf. exilis]